MKSTSPIQILSYILLKTSTAFDDLGYGVVGFYGATKGQTPTSIG
jgi:hypothetical protein